MTELAVLLIDIENVIGKNAKPATMRSRLDALIAQAGADVPAVAACAKSSITDDGIDLLNERQIRLLLVGGGKDAADKALLAEAAKFAAHGCRRFLVASNDSQFGELADLGQLEIIIWTVQKPRAKNCTACAARTYRLPVPQASGVVTKKPATAAVKASTTGSKKSQPKTREALSTAPKAISDPEPTRSSLTIAAIGIMVTGAFFGAGTVLGATAAIRLVRALESGSPRTAEF